MSRIYGNRSEYLIVNKQKYKKHAFILLVLLIILLILYIICLPNQKNIGFTFFAIIFFLIIIISRKGHRSIDKSNNFDFGSKGESRIYFKLSQLPNEYVLLQDITIPGRKDNIDFVVVGPTGIFTIEVKSHSGNISFDGTKLIRDKFPLDGDFLKQTLSEALTLHDYLKTKLGQDIFVQPVLVFSHQHIKLNFNSGLINNVLALAVNDLIPFVTNQPAKLNIELISRLENILKDLVVK